MDYLIAFLVSLPIAVVISVLWVNAIDKMMDDPEWQQHKDDPDYWDWP